MPITGDLRSRYAPALAALAIACASMTSCAPESVEPTGSANQRIEEGGQVNRCWEDLNRSQTHPGGLNAVHAGSLETIGRSSHRRLMAFVEDSAIGQPRQKAIGD